MRLVVVLASPPTTSGVRTLNRVQDAADVLGAAEVVVTNLHAHAADDLPQLSAVAADSGGWLAARPELTAALASSDSVLAAWGLHQLSGRARGHHRDQLSWLAAQAAASGHVEAWCVGGQPRHPSRWHQYVSDRHGRTEPGDFQARLSQVLVRCPVATVTCRRPR